MVQDKANKMTALNSSKTENEGSNIRRIKGIKQNSTGQLPGLRKLLPPELGRIEGNYAGVTGLIGAIILPDHTLARYSHVSSTECGYSFVSAGRYPKDALVVGTSERLCVEVPIISDRWSSLPNLSLL
ncbi:hypothetical protein RRG08_022577 [Elysia crispata]|uniref:Uncharacterized protein n=1 Tax=Elysia crispata TaxID=231223 RepID=A0AAE1D8G1_9GAST|nr:hypothetical protein RRG08_022577 [Elysia crispata]